MLPTPPVAGCLDPHSPSAENARSPGLGGGRDQGWERGKQGRALGCAAGSPLPREEEVGWSPSRMWLGVGWGMLEGGQFKRR